MSDNIHRLPLRPQPQKPVEIPAYAELVAASNFSFLRGSSHPDEMVMTAAAYGMKAVGVVDRNTMAGVVRAHVAGREHSVKVLTGTRIITMEGEEIVLYPRDRAAYGRLSRMLTKGNRRTKKGQCHLQLGDLAEFAEGQLAIAMPPDPLTAEYDPALTVLKETYGPSLWIGAAPRYGGGDAHRLAVLDDLSRRFGVPMVATNDVLYHAPGRRILQDVVTAIREHVTVAEAGYLLRANAEAHLKSPQEMVRLFHDYPDAIAETIRIADQISFSLDELSYEYPEETSGASATPQDELIRLTWAGARDRFGDDIPDKVHAALNYELKLIAELDYAPYFLTVYDLVRFARSKDILCQGRGSAANSTVCYCIGITSVNPVQIELLFERFISAERNEPPDIDVDFEHERREEVIQYIYEKYGRDRAGIAATVITYRARSAIREVGKVMGLSPDAIGALAGTVWGWSSSGLKEDHIREIGLDPDDATLGMAVELARELIGFPRHLSQHVGGFVMTKGPLDELVPVMNAAMKKRTNVEWDKDDLAALGMLKVDVLALGMLSCIAKAFTLLESHYDRPLNLAQVPIEDPLVYDMICEADTVGVFQIESRAQMSMLPRLKPKVFYDLVIEVAIVRPGPIQGDMVHPYLRRRDGKEDVIYPKKELEEVLGRTLGVPLFQEQAMKIAIVAAGFTPAESDQLRRAMATFRKTGTIHSFETKMIEGMVGNGYERDFAERCFRQIEGFGDYGFPESHAASFALLAYVSAWLKRHYPDVFACALLNSQPMGFYAPAQIVRDARDHGVPVLPPDINKSNWDSLLESPSDDVIRPRGNVRWCALDHSGIYGVRIGLRQIKGLRDEAGALIMDQRGRGYDSVRDVWLRTGLGVQVLERLAHADAFAGLGLSRREALWAVRSLGPEPLPLFAVAGARDIGDEGEVDLPAMLLGEEVVQDYTSMRLSLKAHPMLFFREQARASGYVETEGLWNKRDGQKVKVSGLVLVRQRPGTAKGVIFITLEDETGVANLVVWSKVFERFRRIILSARMMAVKGKLQRVDKVMHVVVDEIIDLSPHLAGLAYHGQVEGEIYTTADEPPGRQTEKAERQRRVLPPLRNSGTMRDRMKNTQTILPKSRDFH